ncbi:GGDEF domain-containing protein [Alteromonadaceae bacterium BrNp21-10]|nr:GGDEF domain-containing protein [Alteromonadaceae bacterium BrNp21-10]
MWLPHGLLTASALLAMQFGHSRLCIASILLLISLMLPWIPIEWLISQVVQDSMPSLLMVTMITLLWDRDRGLMLSGVAISIAVVALSLGLFVVASLLLNQYTSVLITFLPAAMQNLNLTPMPILPLLMTIMILFTGVVRLFIQPSNRHSALLFTALMLISISLYFNRQFPLLVYSIIAIAFFVMILLDGYNMAFKDELTGIDGRRALMQFVSTLGKKYAVVMGDVDKFKNFNDKYGHDVGDQVLKMVATCMNNVGGGGRAFRYGGEEFTLVFPNKTAKQALIYVEEVRAAIESRGFQIRKPGRAKGKPEQRSGKTKETMTNVFVTSSFGIAERNEANNEFTKVMKASDNALYKAKSAGRNCTVINK